MSLGLLFYINLSCGSACHDLWFCFTLFAVFLDNVSSLNWWSVVLLAVSRAAASWGLLFCFCASPCRQSLIFILPCCLDWNPFSAELHVHFDQEEDWLLVFVSADVDDQKNIFNEKAFIPSFTSHVIICRFSTCCSNLKYFLSMFSDGNSKLTWQSDCAMWLLCLEVVRGRLSLGMGSVALNLFVFIFYYLAIRPAFVSAHRPYQWSAQALSLFICSVMVQIWELEEKPQGVNDWFGMVLNCLLFLTWSCSQLYENFFPSTIHALCAPS